jgi:hypothetical protein
MSFGIGADPGTASNARPSTNVPTEASNHLRKPMTKRDGLDSDMNCGIVGAIEADMTLLSETLSATGYRIGAVFRDDDQVVAGLCTHLRFGTSGLAVAISLVARGLRRGD